jgi:ABC-type oligopeptide transport system substrate-binding subunit
VIRRAVLGLVVVATAACVPASPSASVDPSGSAQPEADQVLRLAYEEVDSLDPHLTTDIYVSLLVRGLTWFDEGLRTIPGLAESWDITDGGRHVTFHLRDAAYSSGEPVAAGDFVYAWRRLLDPRVGAHYGFLLADVVGAAELLALDPGAPLPDAEVEGLLGGLGVAAPDPRTLEVALVRPAVYFPTAVANPGLAPVPEAWISRPGATQAGAYWSSGPFLLTEWVHDQSRTYEPNPMWWGEPVTLERIEMRTFPSEEAALDAYREGSIDLLAPTTPVSDGDLASSVQERSAAVFFHVLFNMALADSPTTQSRALRQALGLAVDHEALQAATGSAGAIASSPIPPGVPGHDPTLESVYDPDEARRMLAGALDELGVQGPEDLDLTFVHGTLFAGAPYLEQQWRDVLGIEVAFTGLEPEPYFELLASGQNEHDMFWLAWFADYPHPQSYLEPSWLCGSVANLAGYCNAEVDALLSQAAGTADEDQQLATYEDAQRAIVSDAANIFLEWPIEQVLVAPRVDGLVFTPFDGYYGLLFPELLRIVAD